MKRTRHAPGPITDCPACITALERDRMPWQASFYDVAATTKGDEARKRHDAAIRRAERHNALTSLGLVRVRGAMGGTYYE